MTRHPGICALIASLLAGVAPGATVGEGPEVAPISSTISVRLYDYADVPSHILGQAKDHAAGVFERAGIQVVWLAGPVHREAPDLPASSIAPMDYKWRLCELSVRIYSAKMSRRLGMAGNVFGYALQPEGGNGFGKMAITFYERAEILAKLGVASRSVTLGYIIAHEMGHLLLGYNSHARSGIMNVPWNRAVLKRASTGLLNFRPDEVQRIRKGIVAREAAAALRAAAITN